MTLLSRLGRLFKADVHGLLNAIEEPETMLTLALHEMAEEIDHLDNDMERLTKALAQRRAQIAETRTRMTENHDQISLSFEAGNDDLARHFVRQQLTLEAHHKQQGLSLGAMEQQLQSLQAKRDKYVLQRQEIKTKVETLMPSGLSSTSESQVSCSSNGCGSADSNAVEIAFLALKAQWQDRQASSKVSSPDSSSPVKGAPNT